MLSRRWGTAIGLATPLAMITVWMLSRPDNFLVRFLRAVGSVVPEFSEMLIRIVGGSVPFFAVFAGFLLMKRALNRADVLRSGRFGDVLSALVSAGCYVLMTGAVQSDIVTFAPVVFMLIWGFLYLFSKASTTGKPSVGLSVLCKLALALSAIMLLAVSALSIGAF